MAGFRFSAEANSLIKSSATGFNSYPDILAIAPGEFLTDSERLVLEKTILSKIHIQE